VISELFNIDARIPQSTFESETIHLVVERKHDSAAIPVFLFTFCSIFLNQTEGNEGNKGSLEDFPIRCACLPENDATPVENLRVLGYLLFRLCSHAFAL
jgi:hypothetical protein